MIKRILGIDIGAETIKVVELSEIAGRLEWTGRVNREHHKDPVHTLQELSKTMRFDRATHAAVTGRMSRFVKLERIPLKQAQSAGARFVTRGDEDPKTIISIGSHGFSVLEMRDSGVEVFRENSRCSQGTGNFLRQLVERFDLGIEEASSLCENVDDPAPLSGRCPVILKTDMTHLANKGESQETILAGLYDAVCENVQVLVKPRVSPAKVLLIGGVSRSKRIKENFRRFTSRHNMTLIETLSDDALYVEALGVAVIAAENALLMPPLETLSQEVESHALERLPSLGEHLHKVRRLENQPIERGEGKRPLIVGFDIGSTGSKAVALDAQSRRPLWEGYINTNGAPVRAAQKLTEQFVDSDISDWPVVGLGVTGSGREIVGSLMKTCYGPENVFVLNEIAAHAEGALFFDPRVDTIFEIGGQDAKYIRLSDGRVIDAAMNEACSAGTGSFIEEQGKKFKQIENVIHLGKEGLAADFGVSLGQHCSVFMAEIIDEAVAANVPSSSIIAGIYDSIILNYLNRVKGSRSVGNVIFCQGMPFSADALAAAVARQTGSEVIVPPDPGTIGALGISLLTQKELQIDLKPPLNMELFLQAEVVKKDVFVCRSTKGCGGTGNKCRIDRITTIVEGQEQKFTWGGGCSLYDRGAGKKKLPDLTPDPFREREILVGNLLKELETPKGRPLVAMTDEFVIKGLVPLFATFISELGYDIKVFRNADQSLLKRGIEDANVPFCAPMQQYHGVVSQMADESPDYLFLPMVRNLPRVKDEGTARTCPIVQGSADMLKWDVNTSPKTKTISPVVNFGIHGYRSNLFRDSCREIAAELGADKTIWENALEKAVSVQELFEEECFELGARALAFCAKNDITPIVVLGRAYTIYNTVLNSNVPAILREQGALPIPVDCYPVDDEIPVFENMYWGYGQRNLRAAEQIHKQHGTYSLYCSNYSCGPDSFNIHFYSYIMEGKPFAIIETDGHSGDAGTKTRAEAFLFCIHEDLQRERVSDNRRSLHNLHAISDGLGDIIERDATVLIPRMGPGAPALEACLKGIGVKAEALPIPQKYDLELGRRHTSGKECIPMTLTLGSLLRRLEKEEGTTKNFSFFMPTAKGPCRFGSYNMLHKIVLERLGMQERVGFWSPSDSSYFESVDEGFAALVFTGFMASDLLQLMLFDARPLESNPGEANELYNYYEKLIHDQLEKAGNGDLSEGYAVVQILSGSLFGIAAILRRAAQAFANAREDRPIPTVVLVGELYVRCDPFANDYVVQKLEARGIRARFAAFYEWIEYVDYQDGQKKSFADYASSFLQATVQSHAYRTVADQMGWHRRTTVQDAIQAAKPYIRENLSGEPVLTVGTPLHEWREGAIDGVISVGPLECMPNKIAEAQFHHIAEEEGLVSLTLTLNGDPVDPEILDNFAYEVRAQFEKREKGLLRSSSHPSRLRRPSWIPQSRFNPRE